MALRRADPARRRAVRFSRPGDSPGARGAEGAKPAQRVPQGAVCDQLVGAWAVRALRSEPAHANGGLTEKRAAFRRFAEAPPAGLCQRRPHRERTPSAELPLKWAGPVANDALRHTRADERPARSQPRGTSRKASLCARAGREQPPAGAAFGWAPADRRSYGAVLCLGRNRESRQTPSCSSSHIFLSMPPA